MDDAGMILRLARAVLRIALPPWARDAARGDLDEEHARLVTVRGRAAAARWYLREALLLGARYAIDRRHGRPDAARQAPAPKASISVTRAMLDLIRDLRLVSRDALARPGFWTAATLTLGIAIGFNAAIFALVNAVLFRPLAREDPDRVVRLYAQHGQRPESPTFSYLDFRRLRESDAVGKVSAVHLATLLLADGNRTDQLLGEIASGGYFQLLGVPVIAGRPIREADDSRGSPPVALLSEHFWRNRLGADPAVIGRAVSMSGRPFTIVGIVGADFGGSFIGGGVDAWIPLEPGLPLLGTDATTDGTQRPLQLLARLPGSVTREQATAALQAAAPDIAANRRDADGVRLHLRPGSILHGSSRRLAVVFLSLLTAMVGLVLLIAASNVANLQLARTLARRRDLAIRLALGAGRLRLVQQLVVESVVLASGGLAVAWVIAWWIGHAFRSVELLPGFDLRLDLVPDARVFMATAAAALLAGLITTLMPALTAARGDLVPFLREGGGSLGGRRTARLRSALVVIQVGIAVLVCVAAGLLTKSGRLAAAIDLGFDRAGIVATDIDLDVHGYSRPRGEAFYRDLLARVSRIAGVEHAALASRAPLDSSTPVVRLLREGEAAMSSAPGAPGTETTYYVVSPDYLATVGVPVLMGRGLTDRDRMDTPQIGVANEFLVQAMWPGTPAAQVIGRRVRVAPGAAAGPSLTGDIEIVGVARNAKYRTVGETGQPHLYLPYAQHYAASMSLLVRARPGPLPLQDTHAAISALDPAVQGFFTRTLDEHTRIALLPARLASRVSTIVGIVSALLGAIGLHALISCVVAERRREFGLRMALGAPAPRVSREVVIHALKLSLMGCALGAGGALFGGGLLSSLLYGVSPNDPVVYAIVIPGAMAAAVLSAWLPARRASHVDPLVALRP